MKKLLNIIFTLFAVCATEMAAQTDVYVANYYGDRCAAVSYTFDDGLAEHYTKVFPELRKRGLKATFCVIGSKVGRDMKGTPCMSWEQLRTMAADGQEITSHGWAHLSVQKLSGEALRYEVQHNDTAIYNNVGVFPRTYFYPGNRKTDEALAFCSRDRVGTRTSQVSIGSKRDSIWLRKWVDSLVERGEWGVGMTHGITIGYDALGDPTRFWQHLDYVRSIDDKLWTARFCDVSAYVTERDSISLKVKHKKGLLKVSPHINLDPSIFNHPLTLVVNTPVTTAEQDGHELKVTEKEGHWTINFDPNGGTISVGLTNK